MKYYQLPLGPLGTNCYIVANDEKECIIIDPGEEAKKLVQFIKDKSLKPLAVLLTHAHFDHIGAVDAVRDAFGIEAYLHKREKDWLGDASLNGSGRFLMGSAIRQRDADHLIEKEGKLVIGGFEFEIFETPGHSPGSVSFYLCEAGYLFSGDVLFQGSIGRTDLAGGSMEVLMNSIKNKLLPLPSDTIVFPGHGDLTVMDQELETNPFLQGLR
ncbi:MAG: MBL fold metallo-hydrolase [Bacillus sp. (in: firmicutes)]